MKIIVESIGLPALSAVLGKKTQIDLEGASLGDLVDQITRQFGPEARQVLKWQELGLKQLKSVRVIPQTHKLMGQL